MQDIKTAANVRRYDTESAYCACGYACIASMNETNAMVNHVQLIKKAGRSKGGPTKSGQQCSDGYCSTTKVPALGREEETETRLHRNNEMVMDSSYPPFDPLVPEKARCSRAEVVFRKGIRTIKRRRP